MFFNIVAIMITYYFLKPARDSLFLDRIGASQLPVVFILIAFVSAPIVALYSRASRKLKLDQLINLSLIVVIGFLVAFYFLIQYPQTWVFYTFYIWVSIYGALVVSQFWLLANGIFTATQAKRIFPTLALGAIIGAWIGGEFTSLLSDLLASLSMGIENLLFACGAFLIGSIILTNIVWRMRPGDSEQLSGRRSAFSESRESMWDVARVVLKSRHLILLVSLVSLTMMVASFVDFQFKAVVNASFETGLEKGAFFGKFYGRTSLLSFLVQLLLSYSFIRRLGVGGVILFLPIGLLLGSASMLIATGLLSAILLRGTDVTLKYSLDKTGRELLFLPLPLEIKKKTKVFIDLFVDRWFRGLAGGLLLLCIALIGFSDDDPLSTMKIFSVVVMALIAVWIVVGIFVRREYVNTFRHALERRVIDPGEIRIDIAESSTLKALRGSLGSGRAREIAYVLDLLVQVQDASLADDLLPLLQHKDADIREKALRVLQKCGSDKHTEAVRPLSEDHDPDVRREAFCFLYEHSDDRSALVASWLQGTDPVQLGSTLSCLAEYGRDEDKAVLTVPFVERVLASDPDICEVRREVARALGALGRSEFRGLLERLIHDEDTEVVIAAIAAVGRLKDREFAPFLINSLPNRELRPHARNALTLFGPGILGTLEDYLIDPATRRDVRRYLPRVIADIPVQRSVDILLSCLGDADPYMKFYVVKGLNRLRARHPDLTFASTVLDEALIVETRAYYQITQLLNVNGGSKVDEPTRLLQRALSERREQNMERIFRLLGLAYPPEDIYSAYLGIVSDRKAMRASAVEFLDNLLKSDLKKYLLPIVDEVSMDLAARRGRELFGIAIFTRDEAVRFVLESADPWLRACAIFAAGDSVSGEVEERVRAAARDSDRIVRETAQLMLSRWSE
jgi:ATP/ADP translocase